MANPRLDQTLYKLIRHARRLYRNATRGFVNWVLRGLFVIGRSPLSTSGFVLPTTVLLLLILSLTIGAISFRTFTRTSDAISDRQQRIIYNSATPAIDRAKAKLEFLFEESRRPSGIPAENVLLNMMYNDGRGDLTPSTTINDADDYTFPGETRIDLDGNGELDNAWRYPVDRNGDGTDDAWAVYSIIFRTPPDSDANLRLSRPPRNPGAGIAIDDRGMELRAERLMVRNNPLSNSASSNSLCQVDDASRADAFGGGWTEDENTPGIVRKNFQVNALVIPFGPDGSFPAGSPLSSLEFQQDRIAQTGNTWGAWFRNDLEIFPGPEFNWNGAMHSRGNIIVGDSNNRFKSFLISAPASCLYTKDASRVTMARIEADPTNNIPAFQGQMINGSVKSNNFNGASTFNLFHPDQPVANTELLNANNDSVVAGSNPAAYSLDPVILLTQEVPQSRGWGANQGNNQIPSDRRDPNWVEGKFAKDDNRIYNRNEEVPYVDDAYRADNRYGPKPRVKGGEVEIPGQIGEPIEEERLADRGVTDESLLKEEIPGQGDPDAAESLGLDGYWERRADFQGLKLIVSQRLELGNNMGWGGVDGRGIPAASRGAAEASRLEPLRPWNACTGATGNVTANTNRCNEARQRRMLRDNLAAVQSMAVYHFENNNRGMPVACMASTVHPGTPETLARAATFTTWNPGGQYNSLAQKYPLAISNFFLGAGTNGWEFETHPQAAFANLNTPLMRTLQNLAYYAGDPNGGAPSFPPVQDGNVHPYPSMAMWGDFSLLRRVIMEMQDGTPYIQLSPADRATLHSAACTVGMLAYNVDYLNQLYGENLTYGDISDVSALQGNIQDDLQTLAARLADLRKPNNPGTNPASERNLVPVTGNGAEFDPDLHTSDNYIYGLKRWRSQVAPNSDAYRERSRLVALAEMVATKEQIRRDREFGFLGTYNQGAFNTADKNESPVGGISPSCRAFKRNSTFEPLVELCNAYPKYPVMFALLPIRPQATFTEASGLIALRDQQDRDEQRVNYIQAANNGMLYNRITDAQLNDVVLRPRPINQWQLPVTANMGTDETDLNAVQPNNPNHPNLLLLKQCVDGADICLERNQTRGAGLLRVAFKDAALMNGREMMNVRSMDLDVEMLRRTTYGDNYWLPAVDRAGVIFAFREDGVREGAVTRPTTAAWGDCDRDNKIVANAACRIRTGDQNAYNSTDPPIAPNGISPKPVDYYADPDRRPHAFRLKNGRTIARPTNELAGMTLVSDNPVYIMGDFNLHRSGGAQIEEFTQLLNDGMGNFYNRQNLNPRFARAASDQWRPAEIVADAITLLHVQFCDGSLLDAFGGPSGNATVNYGCANSGNRTSYMNQNLPSNVGNLPNNPRPPFFLRSGWLRENPFDLNEDNNPSPTSPVRISRDGNPLVALGSYANTGTYNQLQEFGTSNQQSYQTFGANKTNQRINGPARTTINAVIVSGIVPSRPNQSYGGMHNFPRFISNWGRLYISGSLIQLNFSNSATGPFDQDAWEPGQPAQGAELIQYYSPPTRLWGYDVGLQYAPPGPLSSRFASVVNARSEFYSEPAVDDPYITNLCTAMQGVVNNLPCQ